MKYKVLSRTQHKLHSELENKESPVSWISEFYHQHKGKVIQIDDVLLSYILINADIVRQSEDKKTTVYNLTWHGEKDLYPETKMTVEVTGDGWLGDNTNWNIITSFEAEDLPEYYFNPELRQIVYLSAPESRYETIKVPPTSSLPEGQVVKKAKLYNKEKE